MAPEYVTAAVAFASAGTGATVGALASYEVQLRARRHAAYRALYLDSLHQELYDFAVALRNRFKADEQAAVTTDERARVQKLALVVLEDCANVDREFYDFANEMYEYSKQLSNEPDNRRQEALIITFVRYMAVLNDAAGKGLRTSLRKPRRTLKRPAVAPLRSNPD